MAKKSFYVWGIHSAHATLKFNPQDILEISIRQGHDSQALSDINRLAESLGLNVKLLPSKTLDKLSDGANHQGVLINRRTPAADNLDEIIASNETGANAPLYLALDQIQDPQNLGACLRVADAAGVSALLVTNAGQAPLNGIVGKVASGAMDSVQIVQLNNLAQGLIKLRRAGVWIVGTDHEAGAEYSHLDLTGPICIVLGSEGFGIRQRTRELCDYLVSIPTTGYVRSLNVANAAAVCLFEAQRQRRSAFVCSESTPGI